MVRRFWIVVATLLVSLAYAQRDDLIIGNYQAQPRTHDPRMVQGSLAMETKLLYNALVSLDRFGNPEPDAATWEIVDEQTLVFHIFPGITFSDGTELTAEDVKFTYDTMMDPDFGSPSMNNYSSVRDIEVVDRYTVQFNLNTAYGPILTWLSNAYGGIVPKHYVEANPDTFGANPVGSGPYTLESWTPAEEVVLIARDDYWEGAPNIKRITFRAQPDDSIRLLQLETGAIDVNMQLGLGDVARVLEEGRFTVIESPPAGFEYIGFQMTEPPFDDVRVRQAMVHAINKQQIVDLVFFGLTEPSYGPVPPTLEWAYNPEVEKLLEYNPERARELLAEAGYPNGFSTTLHHSSRWQEPQYAQVLQNMWSEIGVEVELSQQEWGSHFNSLFERDFDGMYVMAWLPIWDPDQTMYRSYLTDNSFNFGGYSNARVDELLELGRSTLDQEKRKEIYEELQVIVVEEVAHMFLQLTPLHIVTHPDLINFHPGAVGTFGWVEAILEANWAD